MPEGKIPDTKTEGTWEGKVVADSMIVRRAFNYFHRMYERWDDPAVMELFDYEARHWQAFDFDPNVSSYRLEHTAMHRNYCQMFEEVLEKFSQSEEGGRISPRRFYDCVRFELRHEAERGGREHEEMIGTSSASERFLTLLRNVTEFESWAASMRAAAEQQRALEDVD
jgi:hypothetical protein